MRISDWSSGVCSSDLPHLEPVRCQALYAEGRPRAFGAFTQILPGTQLGAPVGSDVVVPERFKVAVFQLAAATLAFGTYPQLILVVAIPAFGFPALAIGIATVERSELIDQQHAQTRVVSNTHALHDTVPTAIRTSRPPCFRGRNA